MIEEQVIHNKVDKVLATQTLLMGFVVGIQFLNARLQRLCTGQLGYKLSLLGQDGAQFFLVITAVNGTHQFADDLPLGMLQQILVDVGTDGEARLLNGCFGSLLPRGVVVLFKNAIRTDRLAVLIQLGFSICIQGRGDDELFRQSDPVLQRSPTRKRHTASVLKIYIIGCVSSIATCFLNAQHLRGHELYTLGGIYLFFLSAQLIITTLLIKAKENPCQFLT